jgi:phosphate transport system substrate-binding protein
MNGSPIAGRRVPWRTRACALLATLPVAMAACGGGGPTEIIRIDGSSTVYPITEAVAEEFRNVNKGAYVTVGVSGTGGGFQKFCRGEIDFADASRPISRVEVDACTNAGIAFVELPIAYDGITVVVNAKNTWVDYMTVAELKTLWEPAAEGTIMKWNQLRPSWPDREVHLFGAGVDSGTFDYFTEAITGQQKASRGDYTSSEDDNMLVQGVTGDELALGFFGYAYYEENKAKLKEVPIDDERHDNGQGAIAPTPEAISSGRYRPLSRPVFIYANVKSLDRAVVQQFLDFYVQQAALLVREVGYVPLRGEEYQAVARRASARKTGSMFQAHHAESGMNLLALMQQQ